MLYVRAGMVQRSGPPARQSSFTKPSHACGSPSLLDPLLLRLLWPSDEEEDGEAPTRLSIGFGVAAHISLEPPERIELREDVVVVDMMVRIAADNGQQLRSKRGKRRRKVLDGWLEGDEEEESWVVGRVTWAAVNDALIVCHHYCHSPRWRKIPERHLCNTTRCSS